MTLLDEIIATAKRAVEDNVRHSETSLHTLLCHLYPDATDEEIACAIRTVL